MNVGKLVEWLMRHSEDSDSVIIADDTGNVELKSVKAVESFGFNHQTNALQPLDIDEEALEAGFDCTDEAPAEAERVVVLWS